MICRHKFFYISVKSSYNESTTSKSVQSFCKIYDITKKSRKTNLFWWNTLILIIGHDYKVSYRLHIFIQSQEIVMVFVHDCVCLTLILAQRDYLSSKCPFSYTLLLDQFFLIGLRSGLWLGHVKISIPSICI